MATKRKGNSQGLEPVALKNKRTGDKAAAMSEHGKKKKREAQALRIAYEKKHGKGSLKGRDWDHTKSKWTTVKKNRGNYGNGTRGMRA